MDKGHASLLCVFSLTPKGGEKFCRVSDCRLMKDRWDGEKSGKGLHTRDDAGLVVIVGDGVIA